MGGNASLPFNIKPKTVKKPKFQLEKGKEDNIVVRHKDDEMVESLMDSEPSYKPNSYGMEKPPVLQTKNIKIIGSKQLGPNFMK